MDNISKGETRKCTVIGAISAQMKIKNETSSKQRYDGKSQQAAAAVVLFT